MPPPAPLRRPGAVRRRLARELSRFGLVGAACFVLDVGLFQLLFAVAGLDPVLAKLLSTLVSMTAAFVGHRHWSFADRERPGLRREYVLFAMINVLTLLLGLMIIWLVNDPLGQDGALVLQSANVGSIVLGTVIRFLAYRRWVFPARPRPAAEPV